jgi:endonuclease-3
LRVAPRLGIADEKDAAKPEKIEKQIMAVIPQEFWNEAGMSMSYLGREICRPTNPKCDICLMNTVCRYYKSLKN